MISPEALLDQLKKAGVSDDMLSRGVRITQNGLAKLGRKFGVSADEIKDMIADLAAKTKRELASTGLPTLESTVRYAYEADSLGNVMLRDTETGASKFLTGQEAQLLLAEIERVGNDFQTLIMPYFDNETLREFVEEDVMGVDDGNTGGTYNFPFKGNFACARFWLQGAEPRVEIVSLVDAEGDEIHMDAMTKSEVTKVAWEWIDKV